VSAGTDSAAATFAGEGLGCIRGERVVFRDVSFAVEPGGALILRGPNGSGKSSLLRLACGLLKPAAGRLTWGGADARNDAHAHRTRLNYVGHLDAVKAALTVAENVAFWAAFAGNTAGVAAALERLDLGALADIPARLLSAGQRRRVNLARLAAAPAPLWLLDEPAVSLDETSAALLGQLMADHRARGGIIVAATHAELGLPDAAILELTAATP
jgi:heme exporter protein A